MRIKTRSLATDLIVGGDAVSMMQTAQVSGPSDLTIEREISSVSSSQSSLEQDWFC